MQLVRRTMPRVENVILETDTAVLLTYVGLLGRYEQMDLLERLRDSVGRADGIPALWVLIPADEQQKLPVMDGKPVPVITSGQWARIPEGWLQNLHRGKEEGGRHE